MVKKILLMKYGHLWLAEEMTIKISNHEEFGNYGAGGGVRGNDTQHPCTFEKWGTCRDGKG